MSRVCQITGRGTSFGRSIARRGLPKAKGGVGLKTTGMTKRRFKVNVQTKRIWVPELGEHVRVRVSAKGLRTINKNGAYRTLLKAGLIKPVKPKQAQSADA
jgi:large subunit ribosomal protein L28